MTDRLKEKNSMLNVFSVRDFRLLFTGVTASLLGDQFTLIATPWLVRENDLQAGNSIIMGPANWPGLPDRSRRVS